MAFFGQKHIGALSKKIGYFEIPVEDVQIVEASKAVQNLNQNVPYLFLFEKLFFFLMFYDLLIEVAVV